MPSVDLNKLRDQATRTFAGFTSGQKTMLGIAALATIVGAYFFLQMSGSTDYAPLYSNLQASDAASVTQQLNSQGVKYKLDGGGTTILVPQDKVYQLRLDLSSKGLPTDGAPGYSLLDKAGITTSEFRQRVDYQRALEGEIAKTLSAINGIDGSTVHLVVPKQDVFAADDQQPSASVLLKVRAGSKLSSQTVQAIVHLVASSVEGLKPNQVTVADDQGRMLAAPGVDAGDAAVGDARSTQTSDFQDRVGRSIEDLLAPVTGPGKAKVTVAAQLDFNKSQTTTERFDQPNSSPVLTQSSSSESFTGTGTNAGGALDVSAGGSATASNGDYTKTDTQQQYAVGKVTQTVDSAPGSVQRLSVAVLLDSSVNVSEQQVQNLVSAAAGIDAARGDSIQVQKIAFDTSAAAAAKAELDAATNGTHSSELTNVLRTGGAVLIVALILFLAWRSARKHAVTRFPVAISLGVPAGSPPTHALPVGDEEPSAAPVDLQFESVPAELLPIASGRSGAHDQIAGLIDRQPDDVAQVLRSWLTERK